MSFFKQLPIFSNVSTDILEDLAMKSFMKNIISNTIVAKQDESPLLIYFVYNGRLKVRNFLKSQDFLNNVGDKKSPKRGR